MIDREEMLSVLGDAFTNRVVDRLHRFAFIPEEKLQTLAELALAEEWGQANYALKKYLAVHVPWSVEQEAYVVSGNQLFVSAGHLQTRYGTPIYLVFEESQFDGGSPFFLKHVGSDIRAPSLPSAADIPVPPPINKAAEIVMLHEHILGDNSERVPFLRNTPSVAQICAVSGAIQWSLNRNLEMPYYYYGKMNYLVPLYLQSRENITQGPDVIAPVQVNESTLIVRTVLESHMPYASARVSVTRHDKLPAWMLDAWNTHASTLSDDQIEEPEPTS